MFIESGIAHFKQTGRISIDGSVTTPKIKSNGILSMNNSLAKYHDNPPVNFPFFFFFAFDEMRQGDGYVTDRWVTHIPNKNLERYNINQESDIQKKRQIWI